MMYFILQCKIKIKSNLILEIQQEESTENSNKLLIPVAGCQHVAPLLPRSFLILSANVKCFGI